MLASPVMNMPILCRPYNPYSPASAVQTLASPSNSFVNSPGDVSSTYSASPIHSPQQQMQPEDFLRYNMRQSFQPRPPMPPAAEYGFYYNEYGMKRRKRDDEVRIFGFLVNPSFSLLCILISEILIFIKPCARLY